MTNRLISFIFAAYLKDFQSCVFSMLSLLLFPSADQVLFLEWSFNSRGTEADYLRISIDVLLTPERPYMKARSGTKTISRIWSLWR